jgi:hypothetical protein
MTAYCSIEVLEHEAVGATVGAFSRLLATRFACRPASSNLAGLCSGALAARKAGP